jgi:F-type H+-transporting ATPase subunit delta
MRGSSRAAEAAGQQALTAALGDGAEPAALADELFAVTALVDGNAALRRALADPSRDGHAKSDLVARLFGGRISAAAVAVLGELAAQRWAAERDLTDATEILAVDALLVGAEESKRIGAVEDELFRFERIVAASPELRDALRNRQGDATGKAQIVESLIASKVAPETLRLARQAVRAPRGRRLDQTIDEYLLRAAARRKQLTAVVTAVAPLSMDQQTRLRAVLARIYGKAVLLQVVVDPEVIGGIRIRVGDEVVDGTVLRRLDEARRHMAGG